MTHCKLLIVDIVNNPILEINRPTLFGAQVQGYMLLADSVARTQQEILTEDYNFLRASSKRSFHDEILRQTHSGAASSFVAVVQWNRLYYRKVLEESMSADFVPKLMLTYLSTPFAT